MTPPRLDEGSEREAFVTWLSTKHPTVYGFEDAEYFWRHNHVSVLAWKERAALSTGRLGGAEPVAWECRKRLPNNPAWSEWTTCLEQDHIAIQKNALHWGMVYQSRALCLAAPPAPAAQSQGAKSHE